MGLQCAPDFIQQVMEEVLHKIDNTGVYLKIIGAFPLLGNAIFTLGQNTTLARGQQLLSLVGIDVFCDNLKLNDTTNNDKQHFVNISEKSQKS